MFLGGSGLALSRISLGIVLSAAGTVLLLTFWVASRKWEDSKRIRFICVWLVVAGFTALTGDLLYGGHQYSAGERVLFAVQLAFLLIAACVMTYRAHIKNGDMKKR